MRDVGTRFVQSAREFPLSVGLGKKGPSWELRRWGRDTLGFSPLVEGGYLTRGDRWRVHYAGDRASHRFTILDNEHFEYDIILNKEPESNRLYLTIQGWEGFDFFRQPDNLGPDILRGSYAVYKKEGVINTPAYHVGTGKLCHIHRPRIIDARGRRVWGDIWIDRGVMTMIIPEWWLADAKYPVVVDPVVGSSVAGAYTEYDYMTQENYDEYLEDKTKDPSTQLEWYKDIRGMEFDQDLLCNKCTTPLQLQGTYNAYVYINGIYSYRKDNKPAVYPLLYSDFNNKPKYLLVNDNTMGNPLANVIDPGSYTPHWTQATLDTNGSVAANAHVWFGFWGEYCDTRFDYGAPLFRVCLGTQIFDYREDYNSFVAMTQDFGFYDIGFDANDITDDPDSINVYPGARYDFKVSMYLAVPASYTRTVTQWVKPTESRKLTGKYQRSAKQTALGKGVANRFEGFCRSVAQTVKNTMSLKGSLALIRKLTQQAGINDTVKRLLSMLRKPTQTAGAGSGTQRITQTKRGIADTGKPGTTIGRKQDFKRGIAHGGTLQAAALRSANYAKRFQETAGSAAYTGVARTMALRLIEAVAALYATKAGGGFNRGIGDTAGNSSCMSKTAAFFRSLLDSANGEDGAGNSVGRIRVVQDTGNAEDAAGHVADYLRGLFVEAGNIVETTHRGTYYRTQQDTAVNEGVALRHLFIFLRLLTGAYIRDYIIGRFLKSKEELIIKSPVCREITLESCL